jgi:hypothetical protein
MENFSSPRIERLGPDGERDSEPSPRNSKKKLRPEGQKLLPPVALAPGDERDFDQEDQDLDSGPPAQEKHQLDERG